MTPRRIKLFIYAGCGMLAMGTAMRPIQAIASVTPYSQTFTTHHFTRIDGKRIGYTATVKPTTLTDETGNAIVTFVSTDYVADRPASHKRPVIFAFAGGPSGPSVAYHMQLLGPRQYVDAAEHGKLGASSLRDNPGCLLDIADIVFVDPAETGFSRMAPEGRRSSLYSVGGDAASIEQFMDRWLREHGRGDAPRYVMGGSYGSVRALRIAWDLRERHPVSGIFMTADSLMLQEMVGVVGVVLPLPTMASTAIYYGKAARAGRSDAQIVDEAYSFALNQYLPALARVQDLTEEARLAMTQALHTMLGIPADVIADHDLAISLDEFPGLLLKSDNRVLDDPYDFRHNRIAGPSPGDSNRDGLKAAFMNYMKDELHVTYDMSQYAMQAPGSGEWDYKGPAGAKRSDGGNDWPGMLKAVMESNPKMLVYSVNGLYDPKGVVGQVRWLMSRTTLPRNRILVREYPGGHAVYEDPPTAALILNDLRGVLSRAALGSEAR